MMKLRHLKIIFVLILLFYGATAPVVMAGGSGGVGLGNAPDCLDPANAADPLCNPPRLRGLETTVVNLIYILWVLGFPLFGLIGILIGYQYMTSAGDTDTQETLKKRGAYWVFGIILFFASQPLASALMGFFINPTADCFNFATTPGFTFFFSNVCSGSSVGSCDAAANAECQAQCSIAVVSSEGQIFNFNNHQVPQGARLPIFVKQLRCSCGMANPATSTCNQVIAATPCDANAQSFCRTLIACPVANGGVRTYTNQNTGAGGIYREIICDCAGPLGSGQCRSADK